MPKNLGIDPGHPTPGRASAEEFGSGVKLLVDFQAGHEAESLVVFQGHVLEGFVLEIEGGVPAGIQVRRKADSPLLGSFVCVAHLCPVSG
jgi:hypothetical protein